MAEEFRHLDRVIRILPNVESVVRLMGALLMELDKQWSDGRRYLNMDEYWSWQARERAKAKKGGDCLSCAGSILKFILAEISFLPFASP
ncbi:MAG: transposase [Sporolactobacillus sp.]|jgi:hypothetical protein|nr:transposase [Sporolactobacillus sp.]